MQQKKKDSPTAQGTQKACYGSLRERPDALNDKGTP